MLYLWLLNLWVGKLQPQSLHSVLSWLFPSSAWAVSLLSSATHSLWNKGVCKFIANVAAKIAVLF